MIQFLLPAASALAGQMFGKKSAEAEGEEKLELVKQLANLTPEQARAIDAVKKQPLEEVRMRVELGIGPYAALPANASARAQEIRQRRIDAAKAQLSVTSQEQAAAAASPATMEAIISQKTAEMTAGILSK